MFKTLTEVKEANKAAGYYWFDITTMRFWNSRIESKLYRRNQCFISSKDSCSLCSSSSSPKRIFSVCQAQADGRIKIIQYHIPTKQEAVKLARSCDPPVAINSEAESIPKG
jgi:hypothetical protein